MASSSESTVLQPARLAILSALSGCKSADFMFLQSITGLTKGNLSGHLWRLEEAGLVAIEKGYNHKLPQTLIRLTTEGRKATEEIWDRLQHLRRAAGAARRCSRSSDSQVRVARAGSAKSAKVGNVG